MGSRRPSRLADVPSYNYVSKNSRMKEDDARKWENLEIDVLVKIFQQFDIFGLTSGIDRVCKTWHYAACDPTLWRTLDLSMLGFTYIKTQLEPYVYVAEQSDQQLTSILTTALTLSLGNVETLIFDVNMYVRDDQLTYAAVRCPKLKRLVLPAWNRIKKTGICRAIGMWGDLESLTMPSIANPPYLMEEVSKHCKKFSELKIMGTCDILFVQTLIRCVPGLKVLSIRCSMLNKDALLLILDGLKNLEVLNISHCVIEEVPPPPAPTKVIKELDNLILEKASRLHQFFACMDDSCIMCERTSLDEGFMRWYKYEQGLWKEDEVKSLAL